MVAIGKTHYINDKFEKVAFEVKVVINTEKNEVITAYPIRESPPLEEQGQIVTPSYKVYVDGIKAVAVEELILSGKNPENLPYYLDIQLAFLYEILKYLPKVKNSEFNILVGKKITRQLPSLHKIILDKDKHEETQFMSLFKDKVIEFFKLPIKKMTPRERQKTKKSIELVVEHIKY